MNLDSDFPRFAKIMETVHRPCHLNAYNFKNQFSFLPHVIGHFTVVCSVTWPWIGSEAGGDLVLIQSSLFFICN